MALKYVYLAESWSYDHSTLIGIFSTPEKAAKAAGFETSDVDLEGDLICYRPDEWYIQFVQRIPLDTLMEDY